MASERIEDLRTRQFTMARRGGYDRAEVDEYLAGFADWLETDDAKHSLAGREIERVGERTGGILAAAQDSADETIAEARADAEVQRAEAEAYARVTREDADAQAKATREAAEADAARSRSEADEHSRLTIREADARLERAAREAEERTAAIDAELAELAGKRKQLLANLGQLVSGLRATIDGPGSEDLGLPERTRTAAAFATPQADPEPPEAEHVVDEVAEADVPDDEEGIYDAEAETRVEPIVAVPEDEPLFEPEPPAVDEGQEQETRPYVPPFDDTDEELLDDARPPEPLPSGRDPQHRRAASEDPSTDEQKLTELQ